MNYPPNTHHWLRGARVIHDADAKNSHMLMRVVGYSKTNGLCITHYLEPKYLPGMRGRFLNDIKCLHDPLQFGIAVPNREE